MDALLTKNPVSITPKRHHRQVKLSYPEMRSVLNEIEQGAIFIKL